MRVQGSRLGSQSYPEFSLFGGGGRKGGKWEEEGRRENHETIHEHTGKVRAAEDSWPTELRLRVEARYIDAGVLNAFAATPENPTPKAVLAAVAKWLRDRLPAGMMLHDLRIFPTKPATRGWMGRVSVRSDLADRLLFSSGETGVFVTPKDRAGQICWLPDNASLEAASKHAADNNGRLVANARGLGVCVPDARIRKTTLAILGAEAAGLKGCPVLVVEVPAGMDPSSLDLGE